MKASELSLKQQAQRATVIQTLTAAGWTGRPLNDLFERGFWVDCEATLDYVNAQAQLVLLYDAENQRLELLLDQEYRLDFVIVFGKRLPQVLAAIVAFQDRITHENVSQEITTLLQICPSGVFIYSEDRGIMPVNQDVLAEL